MRTPIARPSPSRPPDVHFLGSPVREGHPLKSRQRFRVSDLPRVPRLSAARHVSTRLRPCLVCGTPSRSPRCATHSLPRRGWAHEQASRQVRLEETSCWICGEPAKPGDPLTADHLVPRIHGGPDVRENMRAAHRSCNSRRGAGVRGGWDGIANARHPPPDPATSFSESFGFVIFDGRRLSRRFRNALSGGCCPP